MSHGRPRPVGRVVELLGTSAGGVGVHVQSLVGQLVHEGWAVTVAAPASTHAVFDFATRGADLATVPIRGPGRELLAVPAVRRAVKDAAIIHAHGLRAGTVAVLSRRTVSVQTPLVVTWHNAVLATGVAARLLAAGERLVARGVDVNLAASSDLVERIRALGGRDVRLAAVAPPSPVASRDAVDVRAGLEVEPGAALIVCVARLHTQKGLDVLIRAACELTRRTLVVIAGDGPLQDSLQEQIDRTRAPVRLLGRRDDVADLLAAADLVVLPSRWEARPLAVQEAMRLARPVVATDVGGVSGLVGDGAVLVPSEDADALAAAISGLLTDEPRRLELARRGAAVAAKWPTEADTARAVGAVYRELLGASDGEAPATGR